MFKTAQEQAYSKIRDVVLDGRFEPGQRIPENRVSEIVGFKRGPVRESLIKLHSEGLLDRESGLGFALPAINAQRVKDHFEMRETIEARAALLAVQRADDSLINKIESSYRIMGERVSRAREILNDENADLEVVKEILESMFEFDEAFHMGIVEASNNSKLLHVFKSLHDEWKYLSNIRKYLSKEETLEDVKWRAYSTVKANMSHGRILVALRHRDQFKAEKIVRSHVMYPREFMLALVKDIEAGTPLKPMEEYTYYKQKNL